MPGKDRNFIRWFWVQSVKFCFVHFSWPLKTGNQADAAQRHRASLRHNIRNSHIYNPVQFIALADPKPSYNFDPVQRRT